MSDLSAGGRVGYVPLDAVDLVHLMSQQHLHNEIIWAFIEEVFLETSLNNDLSVDLQGRRGGRGP